MRREDAFFGRLYGCVKVSLDVGKGISSWVVRAKEIQKIIATEATGLRSSSIVLSSQGRLVLYGELCQRSQFEMAVVYNPSSEGQIL